MAVLLHIEAWGISAEFRLENSCKGNRVQQMESNGVLSDEPSVSRLAEFFPSAIRIRIPVQVMAQGRAGDGNSGAPAEETVIEFGTAREVLFVSALPLEFDDTVQLKNTDGSFRAQGSVVAVQLGAHKSAVAVRFTGKVNNWIIQSA